MSAQPRRRVAAWVLFFIGDAAARVPWDSRIAARIYTSTMPRSARIGLDYDVGPFRERKS